MLCFTSIAALIMQEEPSNKARPEIFDFTQKKGSFNNTVAIRGKNFDSLVASTFVKFNGSAGTVLSVTDSLIRAIVPENATTGKITVTVNAGTAVSVSDFVILPGNWILKKSLIASGYDSRHELISFVIGNKAYAGLGFNGGTSINDLWEYDPANFILTIISIAMMRVFKHQSHNLKFRCARTRKGAFRAFFCCGHEPRRRIFTAFFKVDG